MAAGERAAMGRPQGRPRHAPTHTQRPHRWWSRPLLQHQRRAARVHRWQVFGVLGRFPHGDGQHPCQAAPEGQRATLPGHVRAGVNRLRLPSRRAHPECQRCAGVDAGLRVTRGDGRDRHPRSRRPWSPRTGAPFVAPARIRWHRHVAAVHRHGVAPQGWYARGRSVVGRSRGHARGRGCRPGDLRRRDAAQGDRAPAHRSARPGGGRQPDHEPIPGQHQP